MLAVERGPKRAETPRWSSAMMLGDGALRADDAVASHRAADGDGPSVKAARTYAVGTSRGAVAAVTRVGPRSCPAQLWRGDVMTSRKLSTEE
jgi:hypothetical protein